MPRRLIAVAALVAALIAVTAVLPAGQMPQAVAWDVVSTQVSCTTTRAVLIGANPNRVGGVVQNVGTLHVNIGRGTLMLTLHVGSAYNMTPGYKGALECQTQAGTGSTAVEVIEEVE